MLKQVFQNFLLLDLTEKKQESVSGGFAQVDNLDISDYFPRNPIFSSLFGNGDNTYVQKNEVKEVGENSSAETSVSQSRTITS